MPKIIIELSNKEWAAVCTEIDDWYGLVVTPAFMKRVVSKDRELLLDVAEDVICEKDYKGLGSTSTRERVANELGFDLTGLDWPTGATSNRKSQKFFKALETACKKRRGAKFVAE